MDKWIIEVSMRSGGYEFVTQEGFLSTDPNAQGRFGLHILPMVIAGVFQLYGNLISNLEAGILSDKPLTKEEMWNSEPEPFPYTKSEEDYQNSWEHNRDRY